MAVAIGDVDNLKFIQDAAPIGVKKVVLRVSSMGVIGLWIDCLPAGIDESPPPFFRLLIGRKVAAEAVDLSRHGWIDNMDVKKCKPYVRECILKPLSISYY